MKLLSLSSFFFLLIFVSSSSFAQTLTFAQLTGNPVNTAGWNLTGSAIVNGGEVILTPNQIDQSGTVYYNNPVNLGLCPNFKAEFEFRLFDGGSADGLVFCFLNQVPSGIVAGTTLGVPPTASGLKVAFDTYNNGCNLKTPAIQLLNSASGYAECDPAIVRVNNSGSGSGVLGFIHSTNYIKARIIYNNGNVQVWLEKPASFPFSATWTQYINENLSSPINYSGYFGFSASTGAVYDKQSIRNVVITSDAVTSVAGNDLTTCSNVANAIGTTPNPDYTYAWSPATGLNNAAIANPSASNNNTSGSPVTNQYIVTTYKTSLGSGCVTKDTIQITTNPSFSTAQAASFCIGSSYSFGGQTFTTAGTHSVTLQSQFNCDSIVTLNLTANPAPGTTTNQTICNGDSYLFNGNNYTTSGTYVATFPMPSGCDSVSTLNLTVQPVLASTIAETICQGSSYTLGGTPYSSAGTYQHTFTGLFGCDSLVTLNLAVVNNFTSTFSPVICQGDNYVFDGLSYTTSGTHVATLQSVAGCDSIVTMNLTVNPTFNSVISQVICQGSSFAFNGQNYTTSGTYVANLQSISGCDSIITLNLTVSQSITNTLNETICQGDTYNFNSQNLTTSGTFSATFTSVGGCDSIVTLNLVVTPSFTSVLNDTICQGETYPFNGLTLATAGAYTANLQSLAGCDSVVTLNLFVNAVPVMPEVKSNSPLACPGEQFILQIVNPENTGTYLWTGPNNFTAQGETVSLTTNGTSSGMYSVVLQQNGCNSPAETEILIINGAEVTNFDFPNVITPNADMVNDQLDIDQFFNLCINYELIIWNRWGNLIYSQKFGEKPFSGYDSTGKKVTAGVYFYKLTYEGEERHGSITVIH